MKILDLGPHPHHRHAARRLARPWIARLCSLLACVVAMPSQAAELTLATGTTALALPVHVAEAQGYFASEGVAVRTVDCVGGHRCLRALLDGSAQMATASELPVVFNSFTRSDYAIVATFATGTSNISLIGRRSAGAVDAKGLIGKRVGLIVGTSAQYFLDTYLLFHGIDPTRLTLVPLAPEKLAAAIERKEIDAFAGYSQWVWPAMKALGPDGVVLTDPRIYTETFNLVVGRRTLDERQGDVVKVLRALQKAQRFIEEQPQRAKEVMQARLKLPSGFADAVFPGMSYRMSLEQSLVSTMEGEARWALREGHVPPGLKVPNYLQYVDFGPLRAAVPSAFNR